MSRAKTPPAETVNDLFLSDAEQRTRGVTLKYSPEDMAKLDQFAIGLLGPNSGAGYSNDEIFESRVRAAYLRAEVVLTIRKEIAALEA